MRKTDFVGRDEYPKTINAAYELLVRTLRQFGVIILRGGGIHFRNECGNGGRTSVMFTQTRSNRGEHKYTLGINPSQGDTLPGKYGQLYRYTECYACHCYGNFSGQCPYKNPK